MGFLYLRFSSILDSFFMVPAKTPCKYCVILFLDFLFFLHLGPENSVPISFFSLHLGFIFKALSVGCIKNALIMCSGSESMSELTTNCCRSEVSIFKV